MSPVVFALPGNDALARAIAQRTDGELGVLALHRFPDGETYARLDTPLSGREAIFVCTLDRPDTKILPLVFALDAARDVGATRCGVVAPYLAYLRQDARFQPGEAITSATFARLLSKAADWIVTVDPHLHRYATLGAVYAIPDRVVHAAPLIARWIRENVQAPVLIGPDGESEQWVANVARAAEAPYVVLAKTRTGDREVEVSVPDLERWRDRTPILIDDIVSTARTMIAAIGDLATAGAPSPICVGVHAIFADDAYRALRAAGAARVITCNTVQHESNGIDLAPTLAANVEALLRSTSDEAPREAAHE